ncbi:MAG: ParA family protein [Chloroflexota bacterium]
MKVITLSNEKGGVGKTTMATHIAAGLAVRGQRVLLIDADAQANATMGFGLEEEPGFYDLLVRHAKWNDVLRLVTPEAYEPPNFRSKGLLAVLPGNGETQLISQKIDNVYAINERLQQLTNNIDIVIFDTSPTPSLLHGAIYIATDAILYPTLCESYSLVGLMKTIGNRNRFSEMRVKSGGSPIELLGIIPTMFREKTVEHSENLRELREEFGDKVWDPLRLRIAWSEASTLRRPVFNVDPKNPASRDAWNVVEHVEKALAYV